MTRHRLTPVFVILSAVLLGLNGCYYDNEEELYPSTVCEPLDVSYQSDVVPILSSNCYVCHSAPSGSGGINLDSYSSTLPYAESGILECTISWSDGCLAMPQNASQLDGCSIKTIQQWVTEGMLDN